MKWDSNHLPVARVFQLYLHFVVSFFSLKWSTCPLLCGTSLSLSFFDYFLLFSCVGFITSRAFSWFRTRISICVINRPNIYTQTHTDREKAAVVFPFGLFSCYLVMRVHVLWYIRIAIRTYICLAVKVTVTPSPFVACVTLWPSLFDLQQSKLSWFITCTIFHWVSFFLSFTISLHELMRFSLYFLIRVQNLLLLCTHTTMSEFECWGSRRRTKKERERKNHATTCSLCKGTMKSTFGSSLLLFVHLCGGLNLPTTLLNSTFRNPSYFFPSLFTIGL